MVPRTASTAAERAANADSVSDTEICKKGGAGSLSIIPSGIYTARQGIRGPLLGLSLSLSLSHHLPSVSRCKPGEGEKSSSLPSANPAQPVVLLLIATPLDLGCAGGSSGSRLWMREYHLLLTSSTLLPVCTHRLPPTTPSGLLRLPIERGQQLLLPAAFRLTSVMWGVVLWFLIQLGICGVLFMS